MPEGASGRQNVVFPSGGGHAHAYLARPPAGRGPGVVVIQEWWGLTTHIADVTDRLAREGFVALAPDLFGGATTHDAAQAQRLVARMPLDRAVRDLRGAVDYLLGRDDVTSTTVGAVGFCMGGGFVLALAALEPDRVGAAVPFYGLPPTPIDLGGIRADIQGHYAEYDRWYPPAAVRDFFGSAPRDDPGRRELHFYPAGHAFLNDENPQGNYDPDQSGIAWGRAVEFLRARLGPSH